MVSPLWTRGRAAEMVPRDALALGESRAAPVRSGWAGAPQRGRGNGGKVVRKRGGDDENMYSKVLGWESSILNCTNNICTVKYCIKKNIFDFW